jgi:hypothetical protein
MLQYLKIRLFCLLLSFGCALHAIEESNVLVVYNSQSADSQAVRDYYVGVRPAVHSFDLNDASILSPTVSYADFASKIRNPIRSHLAANNLQTSILVVVLTKGIPHRIQSLNLSAPDTGDNPNAATAAYDAGNATFASVDSELTLLHLNLEPDENGGEMDSAADRAVINPFFASSARFDSFSREQITEGALSFSDRFLAGYGSWWELQEPRGIILTRPTDAGAIYLTARLDASTVEAVKAMIDRAQIIAFRKELDAIILDADSRSQRLDSYLNPNTMLSRTDYTEAEGLVAGDWSRVFADETDSFLTGAADPIALPNTTLVQGPIAHLHSYGVNHNGNNSQIRDYLRTFAQQLPPGASFSAYESFGAVGLGGLGNKGQAQVEEWFAAGGTFATGPVWEPFTFGILKSELFLDRFMNAGFTYVEAAWAGILQLSWQSVVIGDPLATAGFQTASPYEIWSLQQAGTTAYVNEQLDFEADFESDGLPNGYEYILGLDPGASDTDSPRRLDFQFMEAEQTLSLVLQADNANAATIQLQTSATLEPGSWSTIATRESSTGWSGTAGVTETADGDRLHVTIVDPTASDGKRFYRLLASEAQ